MFKKLLVALTLMGVCMSGANAVEVSVSKLRVNLEKGQNADFLVLHNESDTEKQSFNIAIQQWTQKDQVIVNGTEKDFSPENILTDTKNIIISPRTVVLLPKQDKIVRIIANNKDLAEKDYSYRLIITQLPNRELETQTNTVNLLFKISLPIFVYNSPIRTLDKMSISSSIVEEDGKSYLYIKNNDVQHIQLQTLSLDKESEKTPINYYLLPGTSTKFIAPKGYVKDKALFLETDKGNITVKK